MSARAVKKRDRSGRWLSLGLLAGFSLFLVVGGVLGIRYLMDPASFPVRTIRIENEFRHLDRAALQKTLGAAVEGGFFGVDLERVREAALSLPWVAEAQVARVWPDRLLVKVKEQVPVAHWNGDGLVNSRGEVFYPAKKGRLALPLQFHGPASKAAEMLAFYHRVQPGFAARGLEIRTVRLDRRGEWQLGIEGGMTIMVGRDRKDFRIERLLGVYAVLNEEKGSIERIDLRYEQGFAVRRRPEQKG